MQSNQPRARTTKRATLLMAVTFASACLGLTQDPVEAQRRGAAAFASRSAAVAVPAMGVRSGYDFEGEAWSLGGQARLPFARRLELIPSGDAFFDTDHTEWQLNADLAVRLGPRGSLYGGAGLAAVNRPEEPGDEAETRLGTNLFVGLQLPGVVLPVRPFAEARWTLVDGESPFRLAFGANVRLGGPAPVRAAGRRGP